MKRRNLLLAGIALLGLWQVLALAVNRPILPTPLSVLAALWR